MFIKRLQSYLKQRASYILFGCQCNIAAWHRGPAMGAGLWRHQTGLRQGLRPLGHLPFYLQPQSGIQPTDVKLSHRPASDENFCLSTVSSTILQKQEVSPRFVYETFQSMKVTYRQMIFKSSSSIYVLVYTPHSHLTGFWTSLLGYPVHTQNSSKT